eukprot:g36559.t1
MSTTQVAAALLLFSGECEQMLIHTSQDDTPCWLREDKNGFSAACFRFALRVIVCLSQVVAVLFRFSGKCEWMLRETASGSCSWLKLRASIATPTVESHSS